MLGNAGGGLEGARWALARCLEGTAPAGETRGHGYPGGGNEMRGEVAACDARRRRAAGGARLPAAHAATRAGRADWAIRCAALRPCDSVREAEKRAALRGGSSSTGGSGAGQCHAKAKAAPSRSAVGPGGWSRELTTRHGGRRF